MRPNEYEEAGRVCAGAYVEYVPESRSDGWLEYLDELGDVAGRVDRTIVLVAVEDGRILGTVTIEMDQTVGDDDPELPPDVACMRMLAVDPSARGKGVGRALVHGVIERTRAHGKRTLILRTTTRMQIAQRMYRAMGFERDPERDMTFPDVTLLAYRMPLEVSPAAS